MAEPKRTGTYLQRVSGLTIRLIGLARVPKHHMGVPQGACL